MHFPHHALSDVAGRLKTVSALCHAKGVPGRQQGPRRASMMPNARGTCRRVRPSSSGSAAMRLRRNGNGAGGGQILHAT